MKPTLSTKVALITGGASGIGAALATQLASQGAEVWIADRQKGMADELARRIDRNGGRAHAVELDVRSFPAFERVAADMVHRSGRIDFLFNNAGISIGGEVDACGLDDWTAVLDVNLLGVIHGIQAVYPVMIRQHAGHIVNTASFAGLVALAGQAAYTASKHAVVGISKTLRVEGRRHGVRVTVLCPGAVRTPILTGGTYGRLPSGVGEAEYVRRIWDPLRPMAPDVFADRSLRAVLRGDAIIVLPSWYRALWYLDRVSPVLSMWLSMAMLKRLRELGSATA